MARYYYECEAFQFFNRSEEVMKTYPNWFHKAIEGKKIIPCGEDFHVVFQDWPNEHICPTDYVILDKSVAGEEIIAVMPAEEFEPAFKEIFVQ